MVGIGLFPIHFIFGINFWKNYFNILISKVDLIFITILISIFSYLLIEKPARNKKIKFKKIFFTLLNTILIVATFNLIILYFEGVKLNSRVHPFLWKYDNESKNFIQNYNFNNFDSRENILIVGNSYSDDLLNLFNYNENLKKNYYFYLLWEIILMTLSNTLFYLFLKNNFECRNINYSFLPKQYEKADYNLTR